MTGMAAFIYENDGNYNANTDFSDERHLTPLAVERMLYKLDEILPANQKLKKTILKERSTGKPYRGCYGTYPVGCSFCTRLNHDEDGCEVKNGSNQDSKKRNLSSESQGAGGSNQAKKQNTLR